MGDGCHGKAWNAWNAWKWREAQGQLSVLRQRSQEASLIAINRALSYITKLPTCRKTWRLSTATLSSLRSRALRPDVVSETISLTACHRGSAWSFALQLGFFCSQRRGDAIYALEVLRSATWTWQRAAKVLERMEDDGLRLDAKHGAVMAAALSWCSWCRAQAFLSQLHASMLRCDSVLLALASMASPWSSSAVLQELRRRGLRRDVLSFHVAMASGWRRAAELLMEMRGLQMRLEVVSYTLAGGVGDGGGAVGVQDHWQQALLTLRGIKGASLRADRTAQNAALQSVARRSSQWRRAMQMMRNQAYGYQRPDLLSYSEAISAQDAWRWALSLFAELHGNLVDAIAMNSVMTEMSWTKALVIFGKLFAQGLQCSIISVGTAISRTITSSKSPWPLALELLRRALRWQN